MPRRPRSPGTCTAGRGSWWWGRPLRCPPRPASSSSPPGSPRAPCCVPASLCPPCALQLAAPSSPFLFLPHPFAGWLCAPLGWRGQGVGVAGTSTWVGDNGEMLPLTQLSWCSEGMVSTIRCLRGKEGRDLHLALLLDQGFSPHHAVPTGPAWPLPCALSAPCSCCQAAHMEEKTSGFILPQ